MTDSNLLLLLKTSLGEPNASEARTLLLEQKIAEAKALIANEGIDLSTDEGAGGITAEDAGLILMYAEFLITKRMTSDGIPRYLRWALNNKLFKQKTREVNDET